MKITRTIGSINMPLLDFDRFVKPSMVRAGGSILTLVRQNAI